jgi:hypothetical protein
MVMQAPPQFSPDGRFWWNGYQWVPVWHPGMPQRRGVAGYLIASIFIPGLGSLILGRWKWGGVILGVWAACILAYLITFFTTFSSFVTQLPQFQCVNGACSSVVPNGTISLQFPTALLIVGGIAGTVALCAWIAGIVDAIRGTEEWNRAHGFA